MRGMIHPNPELWNHRSRVRLFIRAHRSWIPCRYKSLLNAQPDAYYNYHGYFVNRPVRTQPGHDWCRHEATNFCTPGGGCHSSSSSKANDVSFGIDSNGPMTYFCYRNRFIRAGRGIRRLVSLTARAQDLVNESDRRACVEDHENATNSKE